MVLQPSREIRLGEVGLALPQESSSSVQSLAALPDRPRGSVQHGLRHRAHRLVDVAGGAVTGHADEPPVLGVEHLEDGVRASPAAGPEGAASGV